MAAELKVGIGADVSDLSKGLSTAEKDIQKFSATAGKSVEVMGKGIAKGANQAGMALTNLGRVAQDAPFGFVGIQNNLNPLLESFQRLREESGSNVGALKALGSSLMGPAGLGIALSVVSAGILLYQKYMQSSAKETKNAAQSNEEYINSLGAVKSAQLKGSTDATKELTDLQILFDAYTNANIPLKQRHEAYKQLQEQYPAYFKNLKFEKEAGEATKGAYDRLTESILATARARAAADLIAKNQAAILVNEQKQLDENAKLDKIGKDKAAQAEKNRQDLVKKGLFNSEAAVSSNQASLQEFDKAAATSQQKINDLVTANNVLTERNLQLRKSVTDEIVKGAEITGKVGAGDKTKTGRVEIPALPEMKGIGTVFSDAVLKSVKDNKAKTTDILSELFQVDPSAFAEVSRQIQDGWDQATIGWGPALPEIDTSSLDRALEKIKKQMPLMKQAVIDLNADVKAALEHGIGSAFAGLGESIGAALASGSNVIEAAGAGLLSAVGSLMVELGQAAIKFGVTLLAIKVSLKTLNPAVAIAAGVALVALGSFFKGAAAGIGNKVGGGASGQGFGSPSAPGSGFQPGEVAFSNGQSANTIVASYTIKGQDLHTILTRTTGLNGRMGGK